jgi:hypothetical protein
MSTITIGGSSAWKAYSRGDIGVAFHWLNNEPAMVIYALHRGMRLSGSVPYALPLSAAHELVKDGTGGHEVNSEVLVVKATKAAEVIGAPGDQFIIRKIADAMLEGLDALCDMPPEPARGQVAPVEQGTVQFRADGKVLWEKDASELA